MTRNRKQTHVRRSFLENKSKKEFSNTLPCIFFIKVTYKNDERTTVAFVYKRHSLKFSIRQGYCVSDLYFVSISKRKV